MIDLPFSPLPSVCSPLPDPPPLVTSLHAACGAVLFQRQPWKANCSSTQWQCSVFTVAVSTFIANPTFFMVYQLNGKINSTPGVFYRLKKNSFETN